MNNQITEYRKNLPQVRDFTQTTEEEFISKLNANPPQNKLEKNKYAGNSDYLPIEYIEKKLDSIYGANAWQVCDMRIHNFGSNMSADGKSKAYLGVTISLKVFNPRLLEWIEISGVASGEASPAQWSTKFAALKSLAVKNAAKSLGVVFGRDLNRKEVETPEHIKEVKKNIHESVKGDLQGLHTTEEIKEYQKDSSLKTEKWFRDLCKTRLQQIQSEQ